MCVYVSSSHFYPYRFPDLVVNLANDFTFTEKHLEIDIIYDRKHGVPKGCTTTNTEVVKAF